MRFEVPFTLPKSRVPTDRCYWVVDDMLLAGAYPGRIKPSEHQQRLSALWGAGMRTFVNLMEENETNNDGKPFVRYDDSLQEFSKQHDDQLELLRLSIPDTSVTTPNRMREILNVIDESHARNRPVYVHCFGGMGRTGTVICCWLLRHGLATVDTVFDLLTTLRQADRLRADWPAPENQRQRQFVIDWLGHEKVS